MNTFQILYIKTIKCFIIPCEKATLLLTKQEFDTLTFREAINLRLHLMKCKYCRWFKKEDSLLTQTILNNQKRIETQKLIYFLSSEKIEEIKKKINS